MLDAELLKHPVIRDCVDALVDGRGGLVVYELGLGGRETFVAAAVGIAAATGKTLTIVDDELLREATARLATQLGLDEHTFLSAEQAASWPTEFDPDGVLAVHGDVLRNRNLLEPLRAAARDASVHGHLVVARHSSSSASLDPYTTQLRQINAAAFTPAPGAGDSIGPDTPGPVARRVQSASWQAQQIWEPTWIPRETDRQAGASAQEWAAAWESLTSTTTAAEPTGLSEEARERGRSYLAAWRQLGRTQPSAPDSGPVSAQPDSDGVFWVTQDGSARHRDIWADLEAKQQFLAALPAAGHTGSTQDSHVAAAEDQAHPESAPEDSYARVIRDRLAQLTDQSRARRAQSEQALATPFHDPPAIASGPPSAHDLSQRQATNHSQHDAGPRFN